MSNKVREWARPTMEVLRRYLDSEPEIEDSQDLARAVFMEKPCGRFRSGRSESLEKHDFHRAYGSSNH